MDSEGDFDICINCAAETRYGQSEQVVKLDLVFLGHNRTISPTSIKLLLNIGPGVGGGRKKEVKKATFTTLLTMIVGLTCSIFAMCTIPIMYCIIGTGHVVSACESLKSKNGSSWEFKN